MKIILSLSIMLLQLFFCWLGAATPIDGLYSSIFGGYTFIPDDISKVKLGSFFNQISYNSSYNVGGRFGLQNGNLRYESEITYIQGNVNKFSVNNISQLQTNGQIMAIFGMANIYYDFPEMIPSIVPFAGVGLGGGWVQAKFSNNSPTIIPKNIVNFKAEDGVFAYQGTFGLTYNFAENYALNIAYRYIGTDKVNSFGKIFQAHLGSVGVVYRFDEDYYK